MAAVGTKVIALNSVGQVLILKKTNKEEWDIPGGGLWSTEQPLAGALRELLEETGLTPQKIELQHAVSEVNDKRGFTLYLIYITSVNDNKIHLSSEHSDYKWLEVAEALQLNLSDKYKDQLRLLLK